MRERSHFAGEARGQARMRSTHPGCDRRIQTAYREREEGLELWPELAEKPAKTALLSCGSRGQVIELDRLQLQRGGRPPTHEKSGRLLQHMEDRRAVVWRPALEPIEVPIDSASFQSWPLLFPVIASGV